MNLEGLQMIFAMAALALWLGSALLAPLKAAASPIDLADFCDGGDQRDDTACLQVWIEAARETGDELYASPGTYLYSESVELFPGSHIRCAGPAVTIFKSAGDAKVIFDAIRDDLEGIVIEDCGFDLNGNEIPFAGVIRIFGPNAPVRNIHVRGNRMYDSRLTGGTSPEQRQYILLLNCDQCWVSENHLSEGGRIKVGRPGNRIVIRDNVVEHVNDNAITVVDDDGGVSSDILIAGNVIRSPLHIGIFFGADGEPWTDPKLTTHNARIVDNVVEGDWESACILGVLPNRAARIHVVGNICRKTGTTGPYTQGIGIARTRAPEDGSGRLPVQDLLVAANTVVGMGTESYDSGGIRISGEFDGLRILGNTVRHGGAEAIWVRGAVPYGLVAHNLVEGPIRLDPGVSVTVVDNTKP
jgi:hypothetical protein